MLNMSTSTASPTLATDAVKRLARFLFDDPAELTDEAVVALLAAYGIDLNAAVAEFKSRVIAAFARLDAKAA
jgi:hypothetical protein